jgi:Uma2 family endonuclease
MMSVLETLSRINRSATEAPVSVVQFHEWLDSGSGGQRRAVLVNGVIFEQGPMNPPHAKCLTRSTRQLETLVGQNQILRSQLPLVLGLDSDPVPDLAIVPGSLDDYGETHPTTASLVVEISDSTLTYDLTTKLELYAEAGVPEYWVVDISHRQVHIFRNPVALTPGGYSYGTSFFVSESGTVTALNATNIIRVQDLLP